MSRPAMPYRSTHAYQGNGHLIHHDFATKEERAKWWAGSCFGVRVAPRFTTVTSRKPLKPGTPVCWVNVYEDSDGKRAGGFTYRTEGAAALSAGSAAIHCIPVYLPGEGAEPVTEQMREAAVGYYLQGVKDRQRIGELESEVERLTSKLVKCGNGAAELKEGRDNAQAEVERLTNLAQDWETTARVRAEERDAAQAEVEQWKDAAEHAEGKLSEERMSSQAERKECDKLQAEVDRLTKELAAAQAQAMPAGKVVYGARVEHGSVGTTREFGNRGDRDGLCPSRVGWRHFVHVEEEP